MHLSLRRPAHATVVAYLALFLAMGGTAYAGTGVTAQPTAPLSFTPLKLINGWRGACFGGGVPGIALDPNGVVHLRGEMCSSKAGIPDKPFIIPAKFRPSNTEFVTTDECNTATGRLEIESSGTVWVDGDPTDTKDTPLCFTSLDGVTYTLPY